MSEECHSPFLSFPFRISDFIFLFDFICSLSQSVFDVSRSLGCVIYASDLVTYLFVPTSIDMNPIIFATFKSIQSGNMKVQELALSINSELLIVQINSEYFDYRLFSFIIFVL